MKNVILRSLVDERYDNGVNIVHFAQMHCTGANVCVVRCKEGNRMRGSSIMCGSAERKVGNGSVNLISKLQLKF